MGGDDKTALPEGNSLNERIGSLISQQELADVKFLVGEDRTLISAHRLILAAGSTVFFAMFCGPLAETKDTIVVADITSRGFSQMLKYLYTDDITLSNEDEALETYKAADKYLISKLSKKCVSYLNQVKFQLDTVAFILENALYFSMDTLRDRCLAYIKEKTRSIMMTQGFLNATHRTVSAILALDQLNVPSESDTFEMIICWAVKQQMLGECENLNEILKPVLPFICFDSISTDEFCSLVEKYPHAFSTEEAFSLLMNYMKPGSKPLPEWYKKGRTRDNSLYTRIEVHLNTEVLKMKIRRESWHVDNFSSCICGVFIKDVFQPIRIHGINIEWKVLPKDLGTSVSIDHMTTMSGLLSNNPFFEAEEHVVEIVSESNFLHVSFKSPVSLNQRLPFWIIVRLRFRNQITFKFQEYSGEKTDVIQCKVLQRGDYLPIVSQLLFSRYI